MTPIIPPMTETVQQIVTNRKKQLPARRELCVNLNWIKINPVCLNSKLSQIAGIQKQPSCLIRQENIKNIIKEYLPNLDINNRQVY